MEDGVIQGTCRCGEVVFRATPTSRHRRDASVVVAPELFVVLRGADFVARYRGDRTPLQAFCSRCGTSLYTDAGLTYRLSDDVLPKRGGAA